MTAVWTVLLANCEIEGPGVWIQVPAVCTVVPARCGDYITSQLCKLGSSCVDWDAS